jgi:hypothetical protein
MEDGFSSPSPLSLFLDLLSFIESSKETNTIEEEKAEAELEQKFEELEQLLKKKKNEEKDEKEENEVSDFQNKALLLLLRRESLSEAKRRPLLTVSISSLACSCSCSTCSSSFLPSRASTLTDFRSFLLLLFSSPIYYPCPLLFSLSFSSPSLSSSVSSLLNDFT